MLSDQEASLSKRKVGHLMQWSSLTEQEHQRLENSSWRDIDWRTFIRYAVFYDSDMRWYDNFELKVNHIAMSPKLWMSLIPNIIKGSSVICGKTQVA
jgi:hypothetical protein